MKKRKLHLISFTLMEKYLSHVIHDLQFHVLSFIYHIVSLILHFKELFILLFSPYLLMGIIIITTPILGLPHATFSKIIEIWSWQTFYTVLLKSINIFFLSIFVFAAMMSSLALISRFENLIFTKETF